jgi:hypothetical protein
VKGIHWFLCRGDGWGEYRGSKLKSGVGKRFNWRWRLNDLFSSRGDVNYPSMVVMTYPCEEAKRIELLIVHPPAMVEEQ